MTGNLSAGRPLCGSRDSRRSTAVLRGTELCGHHHPGYVYYENIFAVSQMIARPRVEGKVKYFILQPLSPELLLKTLVTV